MLSSTITGHSGEENLEKTTNRWYGCPVNLLANVNVMHCTIQDRPARKNVCYKKLRRNLLGLIIK